ncbi:MAG: hypothetical protein ACHQRJ_03805 [Alphaproteobacteria bacterium]
MNEISPAASRASSDSSLHRKPSAGADPVIELCRRQQELCRALSEAEERDDSAHIEYLDRFPKGPARDEAHKSFEHDPRVQALAGELRRIEEEIANTPARTLEGVKAKLEFAIGWWIADPDCIQFDFSRELDAGRSALADLARLAGSPAA